MSVTRYTKMAYDSADEMTFGRAKYPVSYGFGIKIGAGYVIPEINYAPRPGTEKDPARLRKEYVDYIQTDCLNVQSPLASLTSSLRPSGSQMNQETLRTCRCGQKSLREFHEESGINCAVRQTIPDQREADRGLRPGMDGLHAYPEKFFECCEIACENGADNLSVESVGGKEFADYAVTNGDIVAFLFGVGYLGSIDMKYIWQEMFNIAKKNRTTPGGETDCSAANDMLWRVGFLDNDVQRTFQAIGGASLRPPLYCLGMARRVRTRTAATRPLARISRQPAAQEERTVSVPTAIFRVTLLLSAAIMVQRSVEYHPDFGGNSVQAGGVASATSAP